MSIDVALPYLKSYELQQMRSTITNAVGRIGDGEGKPELAEAYLTLTSALNAAVEKESPPVVETQPETTAPTEPTPPQ